MVNSNLRLVVTASAAVGVADLKTFYTLRTWLFGWLLRVVFQVLFYALLGRYVGDAHDMAFLLVGGACAVAVLEAMTIVLYTSADRMLGVLPLLVSSPGDYFLVVLSRNLVNCLATGTLTATVALFACSLFTGVPLPFPLALLVIPLIALGAVCTYLFGVFLSSLVSRRTGGRWAIFNLGYLGLTALCGFVIQVGFWPAPLTWLAQILPFTHALRAVRGLLLYGMPAGQVLVNVLLEILVAAGWFVVARAAFRASVLAARKDGSIDLSGA